MSITPRQEAISPNITRPRVVSMFLSIVPFLYSKRTAAARSLVSLYAYRKANVLWPVTRSDQPWNTTLRLEVELDDYRRFGACGPENTKLHASLALQGGILLPLVHGLASPERT